MALIFHDVLAGRGSWGVEPENKYFVDQRTVARAI
jgi:hypothetical protein